MPTAKPSDEWLIPLLGERLSESDLAFVRQGAVNRTIWESATDSELLSDDDIVTIVARKAGVCPANGMFVSSQAQQLLPEQLARKFSVIPLRIEAGIIEIATSNPFDLDCERLVAFATGCGVRMSVASPRRIAEKLNTLYSAAHRVAELVVESHGPDRGRDIDAPEASAWKGEDNTERPVVNLVDYILREGITYGASDIHLEHGEGGIAVRYRVDGILREAMVLPRAVGVPLVSRIKIMAQLDIADRLRPQGGRARVPLGNEVVDLRISTLPAAHGEKVVIRILDPRKSRQSLDSLGLEVFDSASVQRLLDIREGLILVTGPTGSGKTTTLYAALRELQGRGVNIITVEDPVEYRIPGIVQVQINEKAGLTFASALRSILRQDPDVVLIGEIRDRETAAMAIQASLTGHLVFATLHTNDACSSITRLTDLGVDAAKLSAALKAVVAQRLIRRLCTHCRAVAPSGVPVRLQDVVPRASMVQISVGCGRCGNVGYQGRLSVMEIVTTSTEMEHAIATGAGHEALVQIARNSGSRSLWESGVSQMLAGETSAEELMRVVEPESAICGSDGVNADAQIPAPSFTDLEASLSESSVHSPNGFDFALDGMTRIIPGVVDVYVIRLTAYGPMVLVLQRGMSTRCPGSWETVHGTLEPDEVPEVGAAREVREETGLTIDRLYNVTVQPFYLHTIGAVQLAIVFAAFVSDQQVKIGMEHQRSEWLTPDEAAARFAWPREREALSQILQLFPEGEAGAVEDVLRIPLR